MQQEKTASGDLNGLRNGGKTKKGIRGGDATTVAPGIAGTPTYRPQAVPNAACGCRKTKQKP